MSELWGPGHTEFVFKQQRNCFAWDTAIVYTATLKTITENGAIRKRYPEWSDLKTMLFENAVSYCGGRKRCYLKTVTSSKYTRPGSRPLDHEYPKWQTDTTMHVASILDQFLGQKY